MRLKFFVTLADGEDMRCKHCNRPSLMSLCPVCAHAAATVRALGASLDAAATKVGK